MCFRYGMVRKFEKVNKSFNSFEPMLSKILIKARENSTTKTYKSYFEKWKIWATQFPDVYILPAVECHIVLYIMHLLQTGKTLPVNRMSYFAINYFHAIVEYQNSNSNVLEGIKRISLLCNQKITCEVSRLYEMYNYFGTKTVFQTCEQFWSVLYLL